MVPHQDCIERLSAHVALLPGQTNVALLESGDTLIALDTGQSASDAERLLHAAQETFGKRIALILNTHSHADHCGANSRVVQKSQAAVWAPQKEALIMQMPHTMAYMYWGGGPFADLLSDGFVCTEPSYTIERALHAGDVLRFETVSIECVSLTGHCFDQMGFLVTDNHSGTKTFFLGDALFGRTMLKRYWIPFMLEPELFRKSVERIERTQADFFVPGHGDLYTKDTIQAISEMNQVVTLETETLILKTLARAKLTQEELLEAVADFAGIDLKVGQFVLIGCTIRSYLASLYNRGRVSYKIEDNRMLWSVI